MPARSAVLLSLALGMTLVSGPAGAISNGQVDGNLHPNVGAVVFQETDGTFVGLCGASLISSTVMLTTAGCAIDTANELAGGGHAWVSFDPTFDPETSSLRAVASGVPNPNYNPGGLFDYGVIVLATPVTGVAPVTLPALGLLDHVKKSQLFTVVGYGASQDCSGTGRCMLTFDGVRRYAGERLASVDGGGGVEFQMNSSASGLGGACFGDGGDPNFLATTAVQVAVQDGSAGFGAQQNPCHSMGFAYRLDTQQARSFLRQFVSIP